MPTGSLNNKLSSYIYADKMSDKYHNYITFYLQLLYISKQNADIQSCILLNFNRCKIINNVVAV